MKLTTSSSSQLKRDLLRIRFWAAPGFSSQRAEGKPDKCPEPHSARQGMESTIRSAEQTTAYRPPPCFLASSAMKSEGFDLFRTIEAADRHGFDGAQLYLTQEYSNSGLFTRLERVVAEAPIDIAVHLPDNPDEKIIQAAFRLLKTRERGWIFTHFDPARPLPPPGVGLENALNTFDADYLETWERAAAMPGRFRVFDPSRLFHGAADFSHVVKEAARIIRALSGRDLLHLVDLLSETDWRPLGQGVLEPLLADIKQSKAPLVFEYEDLPTCLESKRVV